MALAPSGRSFLEHEPGAVGHGGPDAGELVASRFRMEPRPLDGLLQFVAEQLHLLDIQQVGTHHGHQHGMSLADRLLPGAAPTPGGIISAKGSITGATWVTPKLVRVR